MIALILTMVQGRAISKKSGDMDPEQEASHKSDHKSGDYDNSVNHWPCNTNKATQHKMEYHISPFHLYKLRSTRLTYTV